MEEQTNVKKFFEEISTDHLEKEQTIKFIPRDQLLNKDTIVLVQTIGKTPDNRYGLKVKQTKDGPDMLLTISNDNFNELIDLLGPQTSKWKNQKVTINGKRWDGTINGEFKTGVTLTFLK